MKYPQSIESRNIKMPSEYLCYFELCSDMEMFCYSLPCLQSRKDKGKPSQKKNIPSVEPGAEEKMTAPKK